MIPASGSALVCHTWDYLLLRHFWKHEPRYTTVVRQGKRDSRKMMESGNKLILQIKGGDCTFTRLFVF